jgi:erythromycin esterase
MVKFTVWIAGLISLLCQFIYPRSEIRDLRSETLSLLAYFLDGLFIMKGFPWLFPLALLVVFSCATNKAGSPSINPGIVSYPLNGPVLDVLVKEIGDARVVVLGEASHGTSEFYSWRAAITRRLIEEKGFDLIAVEGDWIDCLGITEAVAKKQADNNEIAAALKNFTRFPQWLWRNEETKTFLEWLQTFNHDHTTDIGFYGLDIFSINKSLSLLGTHQDSGIGRSATAAGNCFQSFLDEESVYAMQQTKKDCRQLFEQLNENFIRWKKKTEDEVFFTERLVAAAVDGEKYYRVSRNDRAASWNIREQHMERTLSSLLERKGKRSKAVVWVHNTHTGDAHYSEMSSTGQTTLAELLRKKYGRSVFLTGFDTYKGTVIASPRWGREFRVMQVPPAKKGSFEELLHNEVGNRILFSSSIKNHPRLKTWIGQRAIGAVYDPAKEIYVASVIPQRYDAVIFIDSTNALHPLR